MKVEGAAPVGERVIIGGLMKVRPGMPVAAQMLEADPVPQPSDTEDGVEQTAAK